MYKFAPASKKELIIFGAARPGYSDRQINEWLEFMKNQDIQRVCCLLSAPQLRRYPDLIGIYQQNEKVVVHCSGGVGRTGQVLAAWLVAKYGLSNQRAIATVRQTGRNPYEAVIAAIFKGHNPWQVLSALHQLLDECRNTTIAQ